MRAARKWKGRANTRRIISFKTGFKTDRRARGMTGGLALVPPPRTDHPGGNGSGGGSVGGGFKSFPGSLWRVLSSGIGVPHSGQRSLLARRS